MEFEVAGSKLFFLTLKDEELTSQTHFIIYWIPLITYAYIIYFLSSLSSFAGVSTSLERTVSAISDAQKHGITTLKLSPLHFLEYIVLGFLTFRAVISSRRKWLSEDPFFWTTAFCSLYAASDEIHQAFVPRRCCSLWDWAADFLGIIFIECIAFLILNRHKPVLEKHYG